MRALCTRDSLNMGPFGSRAVPAAEAAGVSLPEIRMSIRAPRPDPQDWRFRSANDLFKDGWTARLSWSTTGAVALHALLLLWSPIWEAEEPVSRPGTEPMHTMEGVALPEPSSDAGGPPGIVVAVEEPATPSEEAESDEVEGGGNWEFADASGALRERLGEGGELIPGIVEAAPELEEEQGDPDDAPDPEEDARRIAADRATPDFEALESGGFDLDRLTSVRPHLQLLSPSSWILIQNPLEVAGFLERRFRNGPGEGTVRVALWIDERGSVEWAEINQASGDPELDRAALELFNDVVSFRPAREEGVRVPMAVIFSLPYPW